MAHAADSRLESRHSGDENLQDAELKLAKAVHHETLAVPADFTLDDVSFLESYPDKARRRALWKVDIRLLPLLCLCYICSFIDRANIGRQAPTMQAQSEGSLATCANPRTGNAKIEGLMDDLDLDAVQYNTCLAIFFIPYVLLGTLLPQQNSHIHNHSLICCQRYQVTNCSAKSRSLLGTSAHWSCRGAQS